MDYQEVRNIQRQERTNHSLARVSENFYEEIQSFLNPDDDDIYLARSKKTCAEDILRKRFYKIVNKAVVNDNDMNNMCEKEINLFNQLNTIFKSWRV